MQVKRIVRRAKYKYGNAKGKIFEGKFGLINFPGFFAGKEAIFKLNGKDVKKRIGKRGTGAACAVNKEFIGKVIEIEFSQENVNEYFASKFKVPGKRNNI